jgi:hypothetical protein
LQFGYIWETASTSELIEELVKRELMIFRRYQLGVKDIKCPFQWWHKHEAMFPIVGFLARHILGIVRSQIEIQRTFSLARIKTNLRRCHLQTIFFLKLIFVNTLLQNVGAIK